MTDNFRSIFDPVAGSHSTSDRTRSKFLSRVLGIFSEQIVSIWCEHERSRYDNLGRPRLTSSDGTQSHILDFTLKDRKTSRTYVSEMKCEIEFLNFKFFVLKDASQLDHHEKPAFQAFLKAAYPNNQQATFVKGAEVRTDGAILVWGAVDPVGKTDVMKKMGFHDVLSLEDICEDLNEWGCQRFVEFVGKRQQWTDRLYAGLLGSDVG